MKYYRITDEQLKLLASGRLSDTEKWNIAIEVMGSPVQERGVIGSLSDAASRTVEGIRKMTEEKECTKKP